MAENKIIKLDYEAIDDAIADLNALVEELDTMCIVPKKSGENRGDMYKAMLQGDQDMEEINIHMKNLITATIGFLNDSKNTFAALDSTAGNN